MSLTITLIKAPDSINVAVSSMTFDIQGGTLGRGEENNWVLDDPELYLSSLHCEFSFENSRYYITDRSTNGTFFNGSVDPIGKGSKLAVNNNDRFIIGNYEFSITVQEQGAGIGSASSPFSSSGESAPPVTGGSLFTSDDSFTGFANSPFDGDVPEASPLFGSPGTIDSDPLAALDKARGGSMAATGEPASAALGDLFSSATHSDGANPLNQQLDWPEPIPSSNNAADNLIPDDWDIDEPVAAKPTPGPVESASPAPPPAVEPSARERALEIVNQKLLAEIEALKTSRDKQQAVSRNDENVDMTFINALGFAERKLSSAEINQINQIAGELIREMISGMMKVLGSRSSIKNEFRMNVTTIQPVENNPLKFSANVDDALENMFLKKGNAFKQPLDSVHEGFESIAEHQVAIIAGIREAFKTVIERFDPLTLEERFKKQGSGGILPGSQKAKNWEAYLHYYDELAGDIDRSFQYLFGDGFVRAYEDQLQKLAIEKKSRIKK